MAATDARPVPRKNAAFRVTFPILDADGDLVTGASSPDSEVSLDGGTFSDCTNEATEIATSSGVYYLDLTSGEMNADTVAVIIKTGTAGAKTTILILYPQEAGDIRVNATYWVDGEIPTPTITGTPEVDQVARLGSAISGAEATSADIADAVWDEAMVAAASVPGVTAQMRAAMAYMFAFHRNKVTQTATQQILYADDGSTPVATSSVSDSGSTATRGEFA